MRARRIVGDEQGETLLELVVAIMMLGICIVAIGSMIVLSVKESGIHRQQSTADAFLHNYAETLQGSYTPCASGSTYTTGLAAPSQFNAPAATVKYWNASTAQFQGTCPSPDGGLQQVTLSLASADGYVSESLVVVLRSAS